MKENNTYSTHALLEAAEERTDRNGRPYIRLILCDGESRIIARQFGRYIEELEYTDVQPEHAVRARIRVGSYNGNRSYTIEAISNGDDGIPAECLALTAPVNFEKAYNNMLSYVCESDCNNNDNSHKHIAELTAELLEKYEADFKHSAAGKSIHHDVIGGLLHHTSRMVEAAWKLCDIYPEFDRELLVCGAALHDFGKLFELSTSKCGHTVYTPEGRLLGHAALGILKIQELVTTEYDPERVLLLQHLLAAHHGHHECGAVTAPAIPEAVALHALDMLDGKADIFNKAYHNMKAGTMSDRPVLGTGSRVYKAHAVRTAA